MKVRGLSSSSNTQEAPAPPKIPTTARGRGRGRAKRLSATARSKPAKRLAAEDTPRSGALSDSSIKEVSDADGMEGERDTGTLRQTIKEALRQSPHGKVHQELAQMRQELARLSASNAALETELRSTKAELAACRGSHPQPSAEPDMLGLMRREMAAFQQRFNVARPQAAPPTRTPAPPAVQAPATPAANASSGRKRRRKGAAVQQAEALATGAPTPTARGPDGSEWQVVGEARRVAKEARKRRKKAQRQRRQQERKEKRAAALLLAQTAAS
ncbi:hypothetical protein SFRURICE_011475 [Spodoptera frugiperda]|nr:hypothetical protein SFRURICE_011475 [Spodoptera frugiperda]